jgi:hypothetical protein
MARFILQTLLMATVIALSLTANVYQKLIHNTDP